MSFCRLICAVALAHSLLCSVRAEWEWQASQGSPQEAGFVFQDPAGGCLIPGKEALAIETATDQSAWIELPFARENPEEPLSVEVEASSEAEPGACGIFICSETRGLFTWLWGKEHVRISTDEKANHEYQPVDVDRRHTYRLEIEGVNARVSVDGQKVFSGILDEPLAEGKLMIGDMSAGGGKTEIFRIRLSGGAVKSAARPSQERMSWLAWSAGRSTSHVWPAEADALVLTAVYRAAQARQCQVYVLCEGPFGRRVLSAATGHASVASDDFRKEGFFLPVAGKTKSIRIFWEASPSEVPFAMRELTLMPVRILAGNAAFQRGASLSDKDIAQSFRLAGSRELAGVAVPLTRAFDAAAQEGRLRCLVKEDTAVRKEWEMPAGEVPREFSGMAVFLGDASVALGGEARLVLDPGIREPRFFGWYEYEFSWIDPFPGGHFSNGARHEDTWDMTFYTFAGIPQH